MMKTLAPRLVLALLASAVLTGCFRVSSETRALREAALADCGDAADRQIEVGAGFFTFGLAKLATRWVDLPPEARLVLASVKGAECSVFQLRPGARNLAAILARADGAMRRRGCDRLAGVLHRDQLVAVYLPRNWTSPRNTRVSVLVMARDQLVCATARGDIRDLVDFALGKAREQMSGREVLAQK